MKRILTLLLLGSTLSYGQGFSLEGSADVYYRRNISTANTEVAPATSFANKNGFALGMFNLINSYETEKTGLVADLVFGPRGEDAVFMSTGNSSTINQLYAYWYASDNVAFTMGNFNTFLGYEVISAAGNFNYSTSYMFSYGPFSHSGFKTDVKLAKDLTVMLAVLNATDETEFNSSNFSTLGAQLGYKNTYLNALYGKQNPDANAMFQIDLTGGYDLSDKFYLGVNTTYNEADSAGFYGAALYPQYKFGALSTGVRAEYFADTEIDVINLTLTLDYVVEKLNFKLEYRIDKSDQVIFETKNNLSSIALATIYSF